MQFPTSILTILTALLAFSAANPIASDESITNSLTRRACPADCNNQYPLARKLGQPCVGRCDPTYTEGSETCSCNLGAILICRGGTWQIAADCGKTGQVCVNNQPGRPTGGRTCERA